MDQPFNPIRLIKKAQVPWSTVRRVALPAFCQDIEPRRWSHLPLGANFAGTAYAYTEGDIFFNPVLRIEDGEFELHTAAFKYIHAFELFGKSSRIDLTQLYQSGSWSGLLNGTPAATERDGWSDTALRFAVNLYGAPPLAGQEFVDYRKTTHCETIVGMGLLITFPTGEYFEDRLINLGTNRYSFTPQFGFVHTRGKWSMELSSSVTFYTDNDDFFNNSEHHEDPYLICQRGHINPKGLVIKIMLNPSLLTPAAVADLYLLAVAATNGAKLATFDKRIQPSAIQGGKAAIELIPTS